MDLDFKISKTKPITKEPSLVYLFITPLSTTTNTHHTNSMSAISQLLLAQFWQNLKGRFLGHSWKDSNYQDDICSGNICHGDICPYQEYLSYYWPNFDSWFWTQYFREKKF